MYGLGHLSRGGLTWINFFLGQREGEKSAHLFDIAHGEHATALQDTMRVHPSPESSMKRNPPAPSPLPWIPCVAYLDPDDPRDRDTVSGLSVLPAGYELLLQRLVLGVCFDEDIEHEQRLGTPFREHPGRRTSMGRAARAQPHTLGKSKQGRMLVHTEYGKVSARQTSPGVR